jgi:hypothetical protein
LKGVVFSKPSRYEDTVRLQSRYSIEDEILELLVPF